MALQHSLVVAHLSGQAPVAVHVAEVHLAAGGQHAEHLAQHTRLVGGQVDLQGKGVAQREVGLRIVGMCVLLGIHGPWVPASCGLQVTACK